ncbi:MAG TPA: magnesium transporter CorA family protein [Acholeplasmataceae bacterium]|jgi:magnesium transporter|nr:magnesium transporter CorA family protein [Acholeplasmataceae bacterium]
MISVFYTNNNLELSVYTNETSENIYDKIVRKSWIHMTNPTDEEIKRISEITSINEKNIRAPLDEEESAHIDVDEDFTLVVVDTPIVEVDEENTAIHKYYTTPFGIIFNNDYFVTISLKTTPIEQSFNNRWMKNFETNKHIKLVIQILYRNAASFVSVLKQLDRDSDSVQKRLHQSLKNKELFELMSLGKSLVYLSTGINADNLVLEKIRRMNEFRKYEEDIDLIEDAIIENKQAMEMANIHREILNGTMDAFASVISNNVNSIMKTLTVVTIVLTIPTLIASFFGMNFNLPIKSEYGFLVSIILSIILSLASAILLIKYTSGVRKKRRK